MRRHLGNPRTATVGAGLLLATAALTAGVTAEVAAAPPAAAASCSDFFADNGATESNLDDVPGADTPVGMPARQNGTGAVDVHYSGAAPDVLTGASLGAGTGAGDRFGAALIMVALNRDSCADLIIGAPGEGQSAASDGAGGREGQVHIVFGAPGGVTTSQALTLPHDSAPGDGFGSSLAVYPGPKSYELFVGAPGATVGGVPGAGAVFHYALDKEPGSDRLTARLEGVLTQDTAGVPGSSEAGDGFGTTLTPAAGGIFVGAPAEDIGAAKDAGAVWFLRLDGAGVSSSSRLWSQNTPGVPGTAEAGDGFGASLYSNGYMAVAGAPREDVGKQADAGVVQVFRTTSGARTYAPTRSISQNSPGVPGTAEAGDRFGAAVTLGNDIHCGDHMDAVIGVPGEDIGAATDAGRITLVGVRGSQPCRSAELTQGAGLPGTVEAGDRVGAALGLLPNNVDFFAGEHVLIGAPGEDLGAVVDAGSVVMQGVRLLDNGVRRPTLTFSGGATTGAGYGTVLSVPAGPSLEEVARYEDELP